MEAHGLPLHFPSLPYDYSSLPILLPTLPQVLWALAALPFLAFLLPVVGKAFHGAVSTGYDQLG